jgi:hypothetical protein
MPTPSGKVLCRGAAPNRVGFAHPIRLTSNLFDPDQTFEMPCFQQISRAVANSVGYATTSRLASRTVGQPAPIRSNPGPL